jgi:hypothetical protein
VAFLPRAGRAGLPATDDRHVDADTVAAEILHGDVRHPQEVRLATARVHGVRIGGRPHTPTDGFPPKVARVAAFAHLSAYGGQATTMPSRTTSPTMTSGVDQ